MREYPDNHRRLFDGGDDLEVAATLRAVFEVDSENALEVTINPKEAGYFDAEIIVGKGASKAGFNISIIVYAEFLSELNALKEKRIKLIERLDALKEQNLNVDDLVSKTEALLSDVTDSISSYNNGAYGSAKEKAEIIKTNLADVEEKTAELESLQESNEKYNELAKSIENNSEENVVPQPNETVGKNSGGSSKIWVAIGVIVTAVILVVLATSLLPDDYGTEKEEDDQEPYMTEK